MIIGISGATCSGKTSLVQRLQDLFPRSKIFNQDNYYFDVDDPRHTWCKELNHINWELVTAFDNDQLVADIRQLSKGPEDKPINISNIETALQEISRLGSLKSKELIEDLAPVLVEGITIFEHSGLTRLCERKFFVALDLDTCQKRRLTRSYDPPDVPGYFEAVVWPAYLEASAKIKEREAGDLKFLELNGADPLELNLNLMLENILKAYIVTSSPSASKAQ